MMNTSGRSWRSWNGWRSSVTHTAKAFCVTRKPVRAPSPDRHGCGFADIESAVRCAHDAASQSRARCRRCGIADVAHAGQRETGRRKARPQDRGAPEAAAEIRTERIPARLSAAAAAGRMARPQPASWRRRFLARSALLVRRRMALRLGRPRLLSRPLPWRRLRPVLDANADRADVELRDVAPAAPRFLFMLRGRRRRTTSVRLRTNEPDRAANVDPAPGSSTVAILLPPESPVRRRVSLAVFLDGENLEAALRKRGFFFRNSKYA